MPISRCTRPPAVRGRRRRIGAQTRRRVPQRRSDRRSDSSRRRRCRRRPDPHLSSALGRFDMTTTALVGTRKGLFTVTIDDGAASVSTPAFTGDVSSRSQRCARRGLVCVARPRPLRDSPAPQRRRGRHLARDRPPGLPAQAGRRLAHQPDVAEGGRVGDTDGLGDRTRSSRRTRRVVVRNDPGRPVPIWRSR